MGMAPLTETLTQDNEALAIAVDGGVIVGKAPFAGTVSAVSYIPLADITGAATNNRTLSLVNKGADGNGTTVIASLTFGSGTNASDFDEKSITLSAVEGATTVAAGDVLYLASVHAGTGIADPGGSAVVKIARAE